MNTRMETAIDLLYAAVTDSTKWQPFLKEATAALESHSANLMISSPVRHHIHFSVLWNLDPLLIGKFAELSVADLRTQHALSHPGLPIATHRDFGRETWYASPMYRELFQQIGIDDSLASLFTIEDDMHVGFAMFREFGARPYDDADVALYSQLLPHLRRAGLLLSRFLEMEQQRWSALSALDGMPMVVVVTDIECQVIHANALARQIMAAEDGLTLRYSQLWTNRPDVTADLRQAVRDGVAAAQARRPVLTSLNLPREHSDLPLQVRVAAFADQADISGRKIVSAQPVAVLYVVDPARPQETLLELLQRLYGLTNREVELAALLAKGLRLDDAAKHMGVAVETARSFLKSSFGKMGVSSQSDLVRLVVTAPVWPPANEIATIGAD